MSYRYLIILLLFISASCKNSELKKTDLKGTEQVVFKGDYFETEEAHNLNSQGIKYAQQGYIEKGNEFFKKAEAIEPNNPTVLNNLGNTYSAMENYSEAIKYYRKTLEISDSTYFKAGSNLSLQFFRVGKYEEGVKISNYVISKCNDPYQVVNARVHKSFNLIGLRKCEKAKDELKIIRDKSKTIDYLKHQVEIIEFRIKNCVQQGL